MFTRFASIAVLIIGSCSIAAAQPQTYRMGQAQNQVQDVKPFPTMDPAKLEALSPIQLEAMGDELRGNKEMLQAIDLYNWALRKTPKNAVLYNKIGMSYLSMTEFDKAQKAIEKSLKLDKKYPEAYNNLGATFYAQSVQSKKKSLSKIEKAVKNYQHAIALNDMYASFHSNLGTAYIDLKQYDKGLAEYRRAYELDPMIFERNSRTGIAARLSSPEDRAQYAYFMAKLYASNGSFDKALECLGRAMEEGYKDINSVYKDAEFAKLRQDQRFVALMSAKPAGITQE